MTDFTRSEQVESRAAQLAIRPRRLMRTRDAAAYLSISPWKLRSLVADGKLPVVQADECSPFLFDVRDLDSWADRHKRSFAG